jgi:hypothetical protein
VSAPASLAEALAQLQAKLPRVAKEHTAKVETKTGGNYKYDYADLTDVSAAILPAMAALGLCFTACPSVSSGRFVLAYALRHVSDDKITGEYPLPDPGRLGPQDLGKAITYARRYALCAVTGLAPGGDDDDAQAAQAAAPRLRQPVDARTKERAKTTRAHAARSSAGHPVDTGTGEVLPPSDLTDPEDKPGSIIEPQHRAIERMLTFVGCDPKNRDERHAVVISLLNLDGLGSVNDLSFTQAKDLISLLNDVAAKVRAEANHA